MKAPLPLRVLVAAANRDLEIHLMKVIGRLHHHDPLCPEIIAYQAEFSVVAVGVNDLCQYLSTKVRAHRCHVAIIDQKLIELTSEAHQELEKALRPAHCILLTDASIRTEHAMFAFLANMLIARKRNKPMERALQPLAHLVGHVTEGGYQSCEIKDDLRISINKVAHSLEALVENSSRQVVEGDEVQEEIIEILGRVFHGVDDLEGEALFAQQSRSTPLLWIVPGNDYEQVVLRIASKQSVAEEVDRYTRYIAGKRLGFPYAQLERHKTLWRVGAIVYSSVEAGSRRPRMFSEYYRLTDSTHIVQILKSFWDERRYHHLLLKHDNLFKHFYHVWKSRLPATPLSDLGPKGREISFSDISDRLINPIVWVLENQNGSPYDIPWAISHQNLNADNIIVDNKQNARAVNFEYGGPGPILQDFVELESDIFCRLIDTSVENLSLFYEFAKNLVDDPDLSLIPGSPGLGDPFQKAGHVIQYIRIRASKNFHDPREYLWSLLLNTLFRTLQLPEDDPVYRRGLLYCCVLCQRLEALKDKHEEPYMKPTITTQDNHARGFNHGYALLIGVGSTNYEPKLSLPVTVNDARQLRDALIDPDRCAYPIDQTRLLSDEAATREQILMGLAWLVDRAGHDPESTIVVYFSGHGWRSDDGRYALVPSDVRLSDAKRTLLWAEEFTAALRQIAPRRLLVLIDSCHAAGMGTAKDVTTPPGFSKAAPPQDLFAPLRQGEGRVVISSSRGSQYSYLHPKHGLSIFTDHLLESLRGMASRSGDTVVMVSDLIYYLGKHVPHTARDLLSAEQEPWIDQAGMDFPVALLLGGKQLSGKQPDGTTPSTTPPTTSTSQARRPLTALVYERLEQLTENELQRLLLTHFPGVGINITSGMSRDQRINRLVQYCQIKPGELDRLANVLGIAG